MKSNSAEQATLTQLRAYLSQSNVGPNGRLPPERAIATALDIPRSELRKAMAAMEADGQLWRHVGKGTFLGERPASDIQAVAQLARTTNPIEVMRARTIVEPELARLCALQATAADIEAIQEFGRAATQAQSWRQYEIADARLHRRIAEAARNPVMLAVYDLISGVRRAVTWGRARDSTARPPADHHSFADHEAIVAAIAARQSAKAAALMRAHLETVERRMAEIG
jgi:GntR family transcriptional regulator, transcriptional repressor for pyruvate dehydrogenase complex